MILDHSRRDEALEAGYRAMLETPVIAKRVTFSLDEFKGRCSNFDIWGFFDDEPAGMCFLDGNHPHIAILKKFHGRCGVAVKRLLSMFLKEHDELIADVHKDNKRAISFVRRLGFKFKDVNGDMLIYRLGG